MAINIIFRATGAASIVAILSSKRLGALGEVDGAPTNANASKEEAESIVFGDDAARDVLVAAHGLVGSSPTSEARPSAFDRESKMTEAELDALLDEMACDPDYDGRNPASDGGRLGCPPGLECEPLDDDEHPRPDADGNIKHSTDRRPPRHRYQRRLGKCVVATEAFSTPSLVESHRRLSSPTERTFASGAALKAACVDEGLNCCMGDDACDFDGEVVVLVDPSQPFDLCNGPRACQGISDSTISQSSCIGTNACRNSVSLSTAPSSCQAKNACLAVSDTEISSSSCNRRGSCKDASGSTIGESSCNGQEGCQDIQDCEIGPSSCNAKGSCKLNTGDVGSGSCNSIQSCKSNEEVIADDACNGEKSCLENTVPIPSGECNVDFECQGAEGPPTTDNYQCFTGDSTYVTSKCDLASIPCCVPGKDPQGSYVGACFFDDATVCEGACVGGRSCENLGAGIKIGYKSCAGGGFKTCSSVNADIGRESCIGTGEECEGMNGSVGDYSCNNSPSTCQLNEGTIGDNSCNKGEWNCYANEGIIGDGSCNDANSDCPGLCQYNTGTIEAGACNGFGVDCSYNSGTIVTGGP